MDKTLLFERRVIHPQNTHKKIKFCAESMRKQYPLSHNPIIDYYNKIESGEIVVGDKVKRIYKKLVSDVYNNDSEYDSNRANHVIEFIENYCKHSKAKWAGKPIDLETLATSILSRDFWLCS